MGTNYYHRTEICECCGRYNERHIGKSSAGWQFSFRGYKGSEQQPNITSWEEWKKELQTHGKIFNEYGKEVSFEEFVNMVEGKQSIDTNKNHYDYCKDHGWLAQTDWKDPEGYSFGSSEFSFGVCVLLLR